jgi:hypothetical protein
MTNQQKELAGKYYLIADLYSHGYEAQIEPRPHRGGTNVVVNGHAITVLTRFVNPGVRYDFLLSDDPLRAETPFYAFVTVFPEPEQGVPSHEVYIAPSDWVIATSTQLHDDYIRNHPNVNPRQPYTISPDDLQPFQNNWAAMNEYKQTWLFQANPKVWLGFHENFKPQVGATGDWTVSRYRKEIDPGDRVLLWEAGSRGGLLAIGEITGEPYAHDPSDEQVKPVWKVLLRYTRILKEPIQRSTFLKDPVLRNMLHVRVPQGSNFKVTEDEWKVLQKLINQQP